MKTWLINSYSVIHRSSGPSRPRMAVASLSGLFRMLAMGSSLLVLSTTTLVAQAAGITIFKESSAHGDSSAKVFEFTGVRRMGEVTHYYTPSGQTVKLTKFQPHSTVVYPELMSRFITDNNQLGSIENGARTFRGIIAKYPNSARFLNPHLQVSEEIIRRVKGGDVLFNGTFMGRSEYAAMVAREEEIVDGHLAKSRGEKRKAEEHARRLDMETRRHKK
jgi:hypothetical protein